MDKRYIDKKMKDVTTHTSLDRAIGSEGDATMHEKIPEEVDEDSIDYEQARMSISNIQDLLGTDELNYLTDVIKDVSIATLFGKYNESMELRPGPDLVELKKQIANEVKSVATRYLNSDEEKQNVCQTCSAQIDGDVSACPHATELKQSLTEIYQKSEDFLQFDTNLKQTISERAMVHYKQSGLDTQMDNIYGGTEVQETDSLDFSLMFDDSKPTEKLSSGKLRLTIEKNMTPDQLDHYNGIGLSTDMTVDESDLEEIERHSKQIEEILGKIFRAELEEDLQIFLVAYGV